MPDYDFSALGAQYNNEYLNTIYRGLLERGYGQRQAASMLSKMMQDTGGDPYYSSGDGKRSGIMGWSDKEYRINPFMGESPKRELKRQLDYISRNVAASDGEDELDEYGTKVYDIVSAPTANTYEGGGDVVERRRSGGADVSLEGYKQAKRDSIINAAVNKAMTRTRGVTPMINGEPGESCLYTATDNYGRQYRVAGNQTFLANPQNYGFEVNGPVENTRVGDLYQMFDYKTGDRILPSHMSIITGYDENGEPLVTYSRGDAYEDIYGDDYVKNRNVWQMPAYETYRFVGTPSDNARWENEFRALPLVEQLPRLNRPAMPARLFGEGGDTSSLPYEYDIEPAVVEASPDTLKGKLMMRWSNLRNRRGAVDSTLMVQPPMDSAPVRDATDTSALTKATYGDAPLTVEEVQTRLNTPEEPKVSAVIPDRNQKAYFASRAKAALDEQKKVYLDNLTSDEIKALQREYADKGYYQTELSGMSKDEVKQVQQMLVNKGFLSNERNADGSYKEVDGIVGKKTKEAYGNYNVDGKLGDRTRRAYDIARNAEAKENLSFENKFGTEGIKWCAEWVTKKYESVMGGVSRQNGVTGDAWRMPMNIVKAGGTMLYNIYDSGFENVKTVSELKKVTNEKLKNSKFDVNTLQPGDVVGIYYPLSEHHGEALTGTTHNTHVGIVTGYADDGTPIVQHNTGGKLNTDRADKIPIGKIVVAARPKSNAITEPYPFESAPSQFDIEALKQGNQNADKLQEYADSMAGAASVVGKVYPDADMDAVQKIAISVLGRETGFMGNTESSRTGVAGLRVAAEGLARKLLTDQNAETKSSDLTKFKLSTLSNDERAWIGIHSPEDLEDPKKAGLASLLTLAKNYDYFARYAKENPELGLTKEDIEDLVALSYNQGMSRLYKVGTSGEGEELYLDKEKLEKLRELASSDEVIEDFSATKFGRIAKEYPALEPVAKLAFYNLKMGGRSTSYMNSARQAKEKIDQEN